MPARRPADRRSCGRESRGTSIGACRECGSSSRPVPPVLSIDQAIAAGEFLGPTRRIVRGEVEPALARAAHVIEGSFRTGGQEHFYLEPQAALAVPGENGSILVYSSTQNPSEIQAMVAHCLGLRQNEVVCIATRMGGGFGGKESQAAHPALLAALVAKKTGRPARLVYTRNLDMRITGKRHPYYSRYRAGFDDDGRIDALSLELFSDGGCACDLSLAVMDRSILHTDNAYFIPHFAVSGTVCRTNLPPNTAMRGFGAPQGIAAIENVIEEIALFLGIDALLVRRRNCYGEARPRRDSVRSGGLCEHAAARDRKAGRVVRLLEAPRRDRAMERASRCRKCEDVACCRSSSGSRSRAER